MPKGQRHGQWRGQGVPAARIMAMCGVAVRVLVLHVCAFVTVEAFANVD